MTPGQEAKGDNLGESFRSFLRCRYVECIHKNRLDEAILMSTYKNTNGGNLGKSSIFYTIMISSVYSLESPQ